MHPSPTPEHDMATDQNNIVSGQAKETIEAPEDEDRQLAIEESEEERLDRLGRARPEVFKSLWAEIGFVYSIAMAQVLGEYFVSGFTVILPTLTKDLNIPSASTTWPASAFSLTVASFLLIFGRVSDMYGGYPVYVFGMLWLFLWSLIAGFSTNAIMLDFCRALQGLGPAAYLPSSLMLVGSIYRPGPRKNLVLSVYGACAAFGFFVGIFVAGFTGQYTTWGWYFWIGSILTAITAVTSYLTIPSDMAERKDMGVKMDWLGAATSVAGLILFTFAIIQSSHAPQRWQTPYIYVLFIVGSLLLAGAFYIEIYVASQPLVPASFFKVPRMKAFMGALTLTYGSLGMFLLYATFFMEDLMGASPTQVVAWYVPLAMGGCCIATCGGFVMHKLPGTFLVLLAGVSWVVAPLLFALQPEGANYWAWVFPSMICATIGIDITFNVANVFVTTAMPKSQQGLGGAVVMLVFHLGIAVCLGFADIVNTYTLDSLGQRKSYQAVFWFEVGCASLALVILALFVKIDTAKSGLTADERMELEREQLDREARSGD